MQKKGQRQAPALSHNAENKIVENQRRLAVAQQKTETAFRNEAITQNTKVKALELAAKFPQLVTDEEKLDYYTEKFNKFLEIKPVEFEEPTAPLDLVKA